MDQWIIRWAKKQCARTQAAHQTGVYDLIMISVSTIVKLCQIDQSIIMWVPSDRLFILRALCKRLAHAALPANPVHMMKCRSNDLWIVSISILWILAARIFQMPTKNDAFCCFLFVFSQLKWNPHRWTPLQMLEYKPHFIQFDSMVKPNLRSSCGVYHANCLLKLSSIAHILWPALLISTDNLWMHGVVTLHVSVFHSHISVCEIMICKTTQHRIK